VIASAALQRLQPTLMRLRGPSGTQTHRSRADIGFALPVRCSTPFRPSTDAPAHGRNRERPSMDFRSSSELITGTPRRPAGCPAGQTTLPLLDFFCPTTQSQARSYVTSSRSLHHCAPRARFGYPLRDCHCRPSRRFRVGASMGFTLQGIPFVAVGTPLGAPAFLPLPADTAAAPKSCAGGVADFKASFLRRIRAVTGTTSGSSRRSLPGVRPSEAYSRSTSRSL
jgi:hypothetical protein